MRIHALMVSLLATATACSPAPRPTNQAPAPVATVAKPTTLSPSTEKTIKEQVDAWFDCAVTNARQMDDKRSDAGTIAQAVRSACRSLYAFRDNDDLGYATQIVLSIRANENQTREAITPAWVGCVEPFLKHLGEYSVTTVATVAARACKPHFRGRDGQDADIITEVAKKRVANTNPTPVIGRPQPLPPVDKRM